MKDDERLCSSFAIFPALSLPHLMAPTTAQSHPTIPDFGGALESCTLKSYDGRRFILVSKLKKWLNSPLQDSTATHIQILLRSAYEKQFAPVTTNDICSDFLLVFSILLEIGQGHLIEAFLNHSLNDHKLPFNITSLKQTLEAERAQNGDTAIKREVLEAFDGVQWKYCAPSFQLEAKQVHPPQCILPICRRKTINEKGGTAHLWEIEVPEEFVGKSLREKVENSGYEGESGKVSRYQALWKTFFAHMRYSVTALPSNHSMTLAKICSLMKRKPSMASEIRRVWSNA